MHCRGYASWFRLLAAITLLCGTARLAAAATCDTYDGTNVKLVKVVLGNQVYTDVVVRVALANVLSVGPTISIPATADIYDIFNATTGVLTIACVTVNGTTYSNVTTNVGPVVSVAGSYPLPATKPVLTPLFQLPDATVGTAYQNSVVISVVPDAQYTYAIDTLANGNGVPSGMTLNANGILSGTPFATGAADVNANQIPKLYTFGVCATDTLSRVTTSPCPQTNITVNPAVPKMAGTWVGTWSNTGKGDGGCTYTDGGKYTLVLTQTGTSLSGTVSIEGIQLRYTNDCSFAFNTTSKASVTGTITNSVATLQYSQPVTETGGNTAFTWSVTLSGTTTLKGTRVSSTGANGSFTLTHQ